MNRAAVRRVKPGDDIDARGLAGAVRSDEAENFAGGDLEAENIERAEAAEALHQPVDGEERRRQGTSMPHRCNNETSPLGRNITSPMISAP